MPFLCGIIEGFYGRPWTTEQRKELFNRIETMGMNSYMYAPKDDLKHRAQWRELYTVEEADHLQSLITAAKENNVHFYYALSPGLDICYSNQKEINAIKHKLDQVKHLGADGFALLFDDIEAAMSEQDEQKFSSFAEAQVAVANEVFFHLEQPVFMFCPTEYCESRAVPNLQDSDYLSTIGKKLAPDISIFWTGPRVISRQITAEHLETIGRILRRPPLIWDNLHANDYDTKRLFLGPYAGRSSSIKNLVAGILLNPNCEFEANFVPMHTLGQWSRCSGGDASCSADIKPPASCDLDASILRHRTLSVDEEINALKQNQYHPLLALSAALDAWVPEVAAPRVAFATTRIPPTNIALPGEDAAIESDANGENNPERLSLLAPAFPPNNVLLLEGSVAEEEALLVLAPGAVANCSSSTHQSVQAAAVNAVNSLTDDYSEPMELAPPNVALTDANLQLVASDQLDKMPEECAQSSTMLVDDSTKCSCEPQEASSSSVPGDELMQVDRDQVSCSGKTLAGSTASSPAASVSRTASLDRQHCSNSSISTLNRHDLEMLVAFFYLPFEKGVLAAQILNDFCWLKSNVAIRIHATECDHEWTCRSAEFGKLCRSVCDLCVKLVGCANRGFVYDMYPYVWELQGLLNCMNAFVCWLGQLEATDLKLASQDASVPNGCGGKFKFLKSECIEGEPWLVRGGLTTECQRLLCLEAVPDLFLCRTPFPPCGRIFRARPYNHENEQDRQSIYNLCQSLCMDQLSDSSDWTESVSNDPDVARIVNDLLGDRIVGAFLESETKSLAFVCEEMMEQQHSIVGFGFCALNCENFIASYETEFLSKMRQKYSAKETAQKIEKSSKNTSKLLKDVIKSFSVNNQTNQHDFRHFGNFCQKPCTSLLCVAFRHDVLETSAPKRLFVPLSAALKYSGVASIVCQASSNDKLTRELYNRLGFNVLYPMGSEENENLEENGSDRDEGSDLIFYGRSF